MVASPLTLCVTFYEVVLFPGIVALLVVLVSRHCRLFLNQSRALGRYQTLLLLLAPKELLELDGCIWRGRRERRIKKTTSGSGWSIHATVGELRLIQFQEDDPDNFDSWEKLVKCAESLEGGLNRNSSSQAITAFRSAYDRFLAKFPLLFGYWRKYAELEFSIAGTEAAELVRLDNCANHGEYSNKIRFMSEGSPASQIQSTCGRIIASSRPRHVTTQL